MKKAEAKEYAKFITDFLYYLLGVGLDNSMGKGWKNALFVWPFVLIAIIILWLIVRAFLG